MQNPQPTPGLFVALGILFTGVIVIGYGFFGSDVIFLQLSLYVLLVVSGVATVQRALHVPPQVTTKPVQPPKPTPTPVRPVPVVPAPAISVPISHAPNLRQPPAVWSEYSGLLDYGALAEKPAIVKPSVNQSPALSSPSTYTPQPVPPPVLLQGEMLTVLKNYLDALDSSYQLKLFSLARQIPPMHPNCRLSINLPAYRESKHIFRALYEYTVRQHPNDSEHLTPDLFEINVLLNSPQKDIPLDAATEKEVLRFQQQYPLYHVHLLKQTFDFKSQVLMGTIYKTLVDVTLYRNQQRADSPEKAKLILRTGGADAQLKNPYFLARILSVFQQPNVAIYRSECRYHKVVFERFPLLHVLYVLESALNRLFTKGHSNIGLGSYTAEIYLRCGGFNPNLAVAEDVDLAKRMVKIVEMNPSRYQLKRDLRKHAIDNPRRTLWALYTGKGMAYKYAGFGELVIEQELQSRNWLNLLIARSLPPHLVLTPDNLSREVSYYYRQYIHRVQTHSQTLVTFRKHQPDAQACRQKVYEITDALFARAFMFIGIPKESYRFIHRDLQDDKSQARIVFKDIKCLERLIRQRQFKSFTVFH